MELVDFAFGFLYVLIITFIGIMIANRKFADVNLKRVFILSLIAKLIATLLYCIVYKYYYKFGDSINYHNATLEYLQYIAKHPSSFLDFLTMNEEKMNDKYQDFIDASKMLPGYFRVSTIVIHKINLIIGWLGFYLFFPCSILFSMISFIGCWKFSRSLIRLYPQYSKYINLAFLFLPSLLFWSSGINKESIATGLIFYMSGLLLDCVITKKRILLTISVSLVFSIIMFSVKSYILLCYFPFFGYFLFTIMLKRSSSLFYKNLLRFSFLFAIILGVAFVMYAHVIEKVMRDFIGGAIYLAGGQKLYVSNNESAYDLGITFDDILQKNVAKFILPSIVVSLFRPYPWEVIKPIMLFSFIESFLFTFFVIYIFIKGKIIRPILLIFSDPFLFFIFMYTILFAFFVGISSANFGTLVRYKTPFFSFSVLGIGILYHKLKSHNKSIE